MKKFIALLFCFSLLLLLISCTTQNNKVENQHGNNKSNKQSKQITILIKKMDYDNMSTILKKYITEFEQDKGIKVNFATIEASTNDEYKKKLNTKLYFKNGPALVFISDGDSYVSYVDQSIALKVANKIENFKKIYSGLKKEGYFVPIGINYQPLVLNKKVLDELGIPEPSLDWNTKDYLDIKKRWLDYTPRYFTTQEYWELVTNPFSDLGILDESNKTVKLNNSKVKNYIKNVRDEIFSGKYILNKNYTYENYYKMLFEFNSDEHKKAINIIKNKSSEFLRSVYFIKNPLKTVIMNNDNSLDELVILPNVIYKDISLSSWGFIVNKNGENVDLGLQFINSLLSDEAQLKMFSDKRYPYFPVNKVIEKEIERIEKEKGINTKLINLRKYLLSQIELGKYKLANEESMVYREIESMWYRQIAKYVFAEEPYTDEELSRELQKLENEYNIWLNE